MTYNVFGGTLNSTTTCGFCHVLYMFFLDLQHCTVFALFSLHSSSEKMLNGTSELENDPTRAKFSYLNK